jgi:2'-5' RNA ligase
MAYGHAIELFFDKAADDSIRRAWAQIATKAGVPDRMAEMPGSRPHVSLAVFGEVKLEPLLASLDSLATAQPAFDLRFDSLGQFEKAGALFFGPTSSRPLLDLHQRCYDQLKGLVTGWEDYYLPEQLIFHCTLNIDLGREELLRATAAAMDIALPIMAKVEGIGLVKLPEGKFIGSFGLKGVLP